jgi:hypothetical protein
MKRLSYLLVLFIVTGCFEGPTGPQGISGNNELETKEFILSDNNTSIVYNNQLNNYSYVLHISDDWFDIDYDYSIEIQDGYGNWWYLYGGDYNQLSIQEDYCVYIFTRGVKDFDNGNKIRFHKTG